MNDDLKPCPFCGSKYISIIRRNGYGVSVGCNSVGCVGCHVYSREFESNEQAIKAWNRRMAYTDGVPDACKKCANHPSNGGSGNCNCAVGVIGEVTC